MSPAGTVPAGATRTNAAPANASHPDSGPLGAVSGAVGGLPGLGVPFVGGLV